MTSGLDAAPTGLYTVRPRSGGLGAEKLAESGDETAGAVLDARIRDEHARGAAAETSAACLRAVEAVFPEPSDAGLATLLAGFWAAWSGVAIDPASTEARVELLRQAGAVAAALHTMSSALAEVGAAVAGELDAELGSVNQAAARLAELNNLIGPESRCGAGEHDEQQQLIDTICSTIGAIASVDDDGTTSVIVAGRPVVSASTHAVLSVDAVYAGYQVYLNGQAVTLPPSSGAARVAALTSTVPAARNRLDNVANSLASTANGIQALGYDLGGTRGRAMFYGSGALQLSVAISDPTRIAAASNPGGTLDGGNALTASAHGTATRGPDATYLALVGEIALASAAARQQHMTQSAVINNIDNLKAAMSGLSHREKLQVVRTYQRAFAASVRLLTSLDNTARRAERHDRPPGHVRVTVESTSHNSRENFQLAASHLAAEQRQVLSSRQLATLSDNPASAVRALRIRSHLAQNTQYAAAADQALEFLGAADGAYSELVSTCRQVRALVLQGLHVLADPRSVESIARQVDAARAAVIALANTSYRGRPVFGGTTAGDCAYSGDGEYRGDTGTVVCGIGPGRTVAVAAAGPTVFGPSGSDLFAALDRIAGALRAEPTWASLSTALGRLDDAMARLNAARAADVTTSDQVHRALAESTATSAALLAELSSIEDVEPGDLAVKVVTANTTYHAALQTSAGLGQLSLADFLG